MSKYIVELKPDEESRIKPIGNIPIFNFEQLQVTGWCCPFCNHYTDNQLEEDCMILCKMCSREFFIKMD